MPRSAVSDGGVDYVLTPEDIGRELTRLAQHPYATDPVPDGSQAEAATPPAEVIQQILSLMRAGTAVDFTQYKQTTIRRRIQRRVALRGLNRLEEYLTLLRTDPVELNHLY
jgi:two-component system CheB/CheR fusion protein